MQINTNKTKHMVINDQNNQVIIRIIRIIQPTLNNQTLEKGSNYKYLGASIKKSSTATNNGMQYQKKNNFRIYTNKCRNSSLQAALRMKRDGYKNNYTNPRLAEVTTDKYLVESQTIKRTKDKKLKRLQVSKID